MMPYPYPVVPETITVHLGAPGESARNVVVPFAQYIKNVASHEIYPTWPESAIRANILAQISYALNRVATYSRTSAASWTIFSTTTSCGRAAWSRCSPSSATGCVPGAVACPNGAA